MIQQTVMCDDLLPLSANRRLKVTLKIFNYLTPFNFRPPLIFGRRWPKIRGAEKVLLFFGWPKIKGVEIFPKPLYNSKQKRKKKILEGGRK